MSRSYKKINIHPWCCIGPRVQKAFRSREHRRARATTRDAIKTERYEQCSHPKAFGNEWSSPRDGKSYWARPRLHDWHYLPRHEALIRYWDYLKSWNRLLRK